MKPLLTLALTSAIPVLGLAAIGSQPGIADGRHNTGAQDFLLASAPPPVTTESKRQWIRVNQDVRLSELADDLNLSVETLTKLNELPSDASIKKGAWVVLPELDDLKLALSTFLDRKKISDTAPLVPPPSLGQVVKITSGDTLTSIEKRHGLSLSSSSGSGDQRVVSSGGSVEVNHGHAEPQQELFRSTLHRQR